MNKKRAVIFSSIILLLSISLAYHVSAENSFSTPYGYGSSFLQDAVQRAMDLVVQVAGPIFDVILGEYTGGYGDFSSEEIFFLRILLFLLLFFVINFGVKHVPVFKHNEGMAFLIAATISIISIRFMSKTQLIYGVLLPYGAMGYAFFTLVPGVLFFYMIHWANLGSMGRRMCWIVYAAAYAGITYYQWENLGEAAQLIFWIMAIAIIILIFMDRGVHRYFATYELSKFKTGARNKTISHLQSEYLTIANLDTAAAHSRRTAIENQLRALGSDVP